MKKILAGVATTALAVTLLVPVTSADQSSLKEFNESKARYQAEVLEQKKHSLEIYNKVKNDSDFDVFVDNGKGIFAFTYSNKVKSESDKARFFSKILPITAQATVEKWKEDGLFGDTDNGYLETHFKDTVTDTDPWFGAQEELTASGWGTYQWFKEDGNYTNWDKLQSISDTFVVDYDSVTKTSTVTATISGSATGGSIGAEASASVSKTNAMATFTISWPQKGTYNYYYKQYSDIYVKTDNITKYTHTSSSMATVGGNHIYSAVTGTRNIS